jgi:4-hydroxy-tetrahydrodipicolinate synthase
MFGVSAALTTPFAKDGAVDCARLNAHIDVLLSEGCSSVTFFGTTGEGASVPAKTRLEALKNAVDHGVDPQQCILCLYGPASGDVTDQINAAMALGVTRFLIPPPFYYSDPPADGIFAWYASVLSKFKGTRAEFLLYHIPQVIGVGFSIDLVRRVKTAFPKLVIGVKDSSGSFENTKQLLELPNLKILIGDERLLAAGVKLGAAGAISGIANLFAAELAQIINSGEDNPRINQLIDMVLEFPVTPAIKALVAHKYGVADWCVTAPPLVGIAENGQKQLARGFDSIRQDP